MGTFNNITGLNDSSDCSPCISGYYCGVAGSDNPTDLCDAGYFCNVGAETAAPVQDPDAAICPQGNSLIFSYIHQALRL